MPTRADLFWKQSELLFDRWERLLDDRPAQVAHECALYRRWVVTLERNDRDGALVCEVLLEMLAEMMVDAALRRRE